MDDREFERELKRLLKAGSSTETEGFREALLDRCLAVLNADADADARPAELADSDLELLAAAGDPNPPSGTTFRADGSRSC